MQSLGRGDLSQVMTCIHDRPAQLTEERYVRAPDPLWPGCQDQRESISCGLVGEMHALPIHFCHDDAASSLALTTSPSCVSGRAHYGACLSRKKSFPVCCMCPAAISACAPLPQNRSIRPGPVMALPVSWLKTKREAGCQAVISPCAFSTGCCSWTNANPPGGKRRWSVAIERPGTRINPRLPWGPWATGRKKT